LARAAGDSREGYPPGRCRRPAQWPHRALAGDRRPDRSGYINQIALGFAKDYQQDRINRISPHLTERIPNVQLEQRRWYNPDLRSRWFFVPGIVGSLTLVLVVNLTAFTIVREREIGTLEQIMVTPIPPAEFILGKTLRQSSPNLGPTWLGKQSQRTP